MKPTFPDTSGTPKFMPPPTTDQLQAAWLDAMKKGFEHIDQMFSNVLKKFTIPFWLSVIMNVVVFVMGIIGFTVAMIYSLTTGNSVFGLVFGGLDVATVLTFFLSTPIERLERDVGFITWIGLVYTSYWVGVTYATDPKTFQTDLEKITKNATTSIGDLLDKQLKLKSSSTTKDSGTSTIQGSGKISLQNAGKV